MSKKTEKPPLVRAAEKKLIRHNLGSAGLWSVWLAGSLYLMGVGAYTDTSPLWWVGSFFAGGIALAFWHVRYRKKAGIPKAYEVIRVYKQRQIEADQREIQAAISSELDVEELPAEHPLHGIAARVRELGGADERVSKLVDSLLAQIDAVGHDAESLREAVATEQSLSSSLDDPRIERLNRILADKDALLAQLTGALRDLHLELTARQDEDHEVLFNQVGDLLAGLSAEAEVAQVVADVSADADHKRKLQAIKAKQNQS